MILVRVHIYGFGHLNDEIFEFPEQGITVLYGPNEAGKSTILECIRSVLFGFESSKSRARYEPVNGGRFGAKLTFRVDHDRSAQVAMRGQIDATGIDRAQDTILVERIFNGRSLRGDVKVLNENGEVLGSEENLQDLLHHLSPQVYKSVFAFSLTELEDLHSLSEKDIQARIHSAGMGIKSVSPIELERKLENKRLALYRKRGQDQPITKLIREKQDIKKQIQQLSDLPRQYANLQSEYRLLQQKLEELKQKKQQADLDLDTIATHAAVREFWEETVPLQKMLESFPDLPACPASDYFDWQEQIAELQRLEQQMKDLELSIQQLDDVLAHSSNPGIWLANWQEIAGLYDTRSGTADALERMKRLDWEINQLELKIHSAIKRIGNLTDLAQLQQIRISMVEYEAIRKQGETVQQLREQLTSQTAQLSKLELEQEQVEDQYEQLARQWQRVQTTQTLDADTILQQQAELQRLQKLVFEIDSLRSRLQESKQHLENLRMQQSQNHKQDNNRGFEPKDVQSRTQRKKRGISNATSWYRNLILASFLLITLLFLITLWLPKSSSATFASVVGACILLGSGYYVYRISIKRNGSSSIGRLGPDPLVSFIQTFEQDIDSIQARLSHAFDELQVSAQRLGLTISSDDTQYLLTQLQQCATKLQKAKDNMDASERIKERMHDVAQQRERIRSFYTKTKQAIELLNHDKKQWESQWTLWLKNHHLPVELMPDSAYIFLQTVERAQELYQEMQTKLKEKEQLQTQVNTYLQRLANVVNATSISPSGSTSLSADQACATSDSVEYKYAAGVTGNGTVKPDNWLMCLQTLYEQAQAKRVEAAKQESMKQECQDRRRQMESLQKMQEQLQSRLNAWLSERGFEDSAEVSQSYEWTVKRQEIEQQLQLLYAKMETKMDTSKSFQDVLKSVQEYDLATWQRKLEDAEQARQLIQDEMEECRRLQGKLEQEIEQFEKATTHSQLIHKMSRIDAELQESAEEWAVYTLTQKLLEKARKTYEKERQPAVLRQASEWFQTITDQRYQKIISPFGSDSLEVVTFDQTQLPTTALSRGTAEQLYLTMRFALIDELAEKGIHAPIILDDVFVNFDPDRLRATLQVLEDLGYRHQILYLTCHPHIVERIRSQTSLYEVVSV